MSADLSAWSHLTETSGQMAAVEGFAVSCTARSHHQQSDQFSTLTATPAIVRDFVTNSISGATKRAYEADIRHYAGWGGTIPSHPARIAEYLAALAYTHKAATIARRLASLSKAHRARGVDDPCKAEIVKATARGIKRMIGTAQREAKPLLREDLFQVLERMGNRPKDIRDKALLLLGFAGAFRRSELVGLDVTDIEHVRHGVVVTLRRSKTDQSRAGRKIGIPLGRTRWCPVRHLTDWLDFRGNANGPIFSAIDRHGHVADHRLSREAVSIIVKKRTEAAGFHPDAYSGHSLRSGLATSAVVAGVSTLSIRRTTGHASDAMLARYVRIGDLFADNAAAKVL
ncbi:site-specific integrase [Mesorhizobium sp. IMUNJ 23232]|uniref:site-specific integrase n=1 Tax=Mesorhizobium sp. IMUNJ 23232 TaxID=3376064 RepID=UPI00378D55AC